MFLIAEIRGEVFYVGAIFGPVNDTLFLVRPEEANVEEGGVCIHWEKIDNEDVPDEFCLQMRLPDGRVRRLRPVKTLWDNDVESSFTLCLRPVGVISSKFYMKWHPHRSVMTYESMFARIMKSMNSHRGEIAMRLTKNAEDATVLYLQDCLLTHGLK